MNDLQKIDSSQEIKSNTSSDLIPFIFTTKKESEAKARNIDEDTKTKKWERWWNKLVYAAFWIFVGFCLGFLFGYYKTNVN